MTLILLPNLLDETLEISEYLVPAVQTAVSQIDGLIAESEKGGRVFLKRFLYQSPKTFRDIPIKVLSEHTKEHELIELLEPLLKKEKWGLISDCGLPCIADPGASLVLKAHQHQIKLETFPGPSSIIYALMLSGLSGNHFSFHGYLPRKKEELLEKLKDLAAVKSHTHVFIEAPYRTEKMLNELTCTLPQDTFLSVSWNLTLPSQRVVTKTINEWRKSTLPPLEKTPAVFVFAAPKINEKKSQASFKKKPGTSSGFYKKRKR